MFPVPDNCILNAKVIIGTHLSKANKMAYDLRTSPRFLEIAFRHTEVTPLRNEFITAILKLAGCEAIGTSLLDEDGNGDINKRCALTAACSGFIGSRKAMINAVVHRF